MPTTTQERLPLAGVDGRTGLELTPDTAGGWRLDERTREIGRRGLAEARAALAAAARRAAERDERADPAHRHAA